MQDKPSYFGSLALLTSLFFIWGFITCLNDILIPHLKSVFLLNYARAMLVQFAFFAAYFVMSIPSGYFVKTVGYKPGIVSGLLLAGTGCLLFYPASESVSYPLFLTAVFTLACGITLLQVAANPYITLLRSPHPASSRLTLTQAFNSLGTTLAPLFGSSLLLSATIKTNQELSTLTAEALLAYQNAQVKLVQLPYLSTAIALLLIAAVFFLVRLPAVEPGSTVKPNQTHQNNPPDAWRYRHLILGALAIFLYVGAEVAIGSFLVNYLSEKTIAGLPPHVAGQYVSFYWGGAMLGRFIGAMLLRWFAANRLLLTNALVAATLVLITISSSGPVAQWSILAVGLFNSIMFPVIFSLAVRELGPYTSQASGILCTAIIGGAVIPVLQGLLADRVGIQPAFMIPAFCYLYVAFYGWRGYQIKIL